MNEATADGGVVTPGARLAHQSWTPTSIRVSLLPTTRRVAVRVGAHTSNAFELPAQRFRLVGDTADGSLEFRDDVTVWRNGTVLDDDRNGASTVHAPIEFSADRTATLRLQFRSALAFGGSSGISLATPDGARGRWRGSVTFRRHGHW